MGSHGVARALSSLPLLHYLDSSKDDMLDHANPSNDAKARREMARSSSGSSNPGSSEELAAAGAAAGSGAFSNDEGLSARRAATPLEREDAWVRRVRLEAERANLKVDLVTHPRGASWTPSQSPSHLIEHTFEFAIRTMRFSHSIFPFPIRLSDSIFRFEFPIRFVMSPLIKGPRGGPPSRF